MKCSILAVLLLQFIWIESAFLPKSVEDYYWRDYNGLVPSDAIPAGKNSKGELLFFGQFGVGYPQVQLKINTIAATITEGSPIAQGAYDHLTVNSTDESSLKILCAASLSKYQWRNIKDHLPPNCRYVIGGKEVGDSLYIGGVQPDVNTIIIGKVFANRFPYKLITPENGLESSYYAFLVLTYCN